jgi:aspartate aminotransferase-like enzyme
MKGRIFRIAHLGYFDIADLFAVIAELELILDANGVPVKLGTGGSGAAVLRGAGGASPSRCKLDNATY